MLSTLNIVFFSRNSPLNITLSYVKYIIFSVYIHLCFCVSLTFLKL